MDFTILAQPPTPDPAETDAPHGPTLAVVVKALMKIYDWYGDISAPVPVRNLEALARMIEREAGGDGR